MAEYRFAGEHEHAGLVLEPNVRPESVDQVRAMETVEGDVLIASYPKTGTTWMEELVWTVSKSGDLEEAKVTPLFNRMLYLEFTSPVAKKSGIDRLSAVPRPAIMKTHLPATFIQSQIAEGRLKVIVTVRNPKDTLVSLYHFYRMNAGLGNFAGSWPEFFQLYKTKHLIYGDYFDWYASWLPYLDSPNVLVVAYEDMKSDIRAVLGRLSTFLGQNLDSETTDKIIEYTSFSKMKSNKMTNYELLAAFKSEVSPFMRKGEVGDWKNYFDDDQNGYVDKEYKEKLEVKGLKLRFE